MAAVTKVHLRKTLPPSLENYKDIVHPLLMQTRTTILSKWL